MSTRQVARAMIVSFLALTFEALTFGTGAQIARGDDPQPAPAEPTASLKELEAIRARLSELEKQLGQPGKSAPQGAKAEADKADLEKRFSLSLQSVHWGPPAMAVNLPAPGVRMGRSAVFCLAGKLTIANHTKKALTVKRSDIHLELNGQRLVCEEATVSVQQQPLLLDTEFVRVADAKPAESLTVPPSESGSTWILFPTIPPPSNERRLIVTVQIGDETQRLDVVASQRDRLQLTTTRLGPAGEVGLLTIGGVLNSVNISALAEEIDRLGGLGVDTVIIRGNALARNRGHLLAAWMLVSSPSPAVPRDARAFEPWPGSVQYAHLVIPGLSKPFDPRQARPSPSMYAMPSSSLAFNQYGPARPFSAAQTAPKITVHESAEDAARDALRTAYEHLTREELVKAIEQGDVLTRAAALATGAGRLTSDQLPFVLTATDDPNIAIQQAALAALQHFGQPEAVAKLAQYARGGAVALADTSLDSLAASRHAAANDVLIEILKNEPPPSQQRIISRMVAHPRPAFAEAVYQMRGQGGAARSIEAIQLIAAALHPKLLEVLKEALHDGNAVTRDQALRILQSRNDTEATEIAVAFILEHLKVHAPSGAMLGILEQTKERRAVPLLMARFDEATSMRSAMLRTVAQIGDPSAGPLIVEKYARMEPQEKSSALRALREVQAAEYATLAQEALRAPDRGTATEAVQVLESMPPKEAAALASQALEIATSHTWNTLFSALAQQGTPEARAVLSKAIVTSKDPEKQKAARTYLDQLLHRSPAYQYVMRGQQLLREQNIVEAQEQFEVAERLEAELPEALVGLAQVRFQSADLAGAARAYRRAMSLDPLNPYAAAGSCLILVREGKDAEGLKNLRQHDEAFANDFAYAYESACVYAAAVDNLRQLVTRTEEHEKQLVAVENDGLAAIERAVKLGFRDGQLLNSDPRLEALRGAQRFKAAAARVGPVRQSTPRRRP